LALLLFLMQNSEPSHSIDGRVNVASDDNAGLARQFELVD
jgi:hypothetical protein